MNTLKRGSYLLSAAVLIFLIISGTAAAQFRTPRPSPNASVNQLVGVTEITIHYSRPGVKNRVIWGELVPYNQVWRTGANEVTSITFSDPVTISDGTGTGPTRHLRNTHYTVKMNGQLFSARIRK
jgi:hypothetical protein